MDMLNAQIGVKKLWSQPETWHCHDSDGPSLVSVSHRPGRVPGEYLKRGKVQAKNSPNQLMAVVEDVSEKMKQNPLAFAQEVGRKIEKTVEKNAPSFAQVGSAVQSLRKNAWAFAGPMISQPRKMPVAVRAG